jgi:predicted ATP-grasp superfamily ATP-dependent carboligase
MGRLNKNEINTRIATLLYALSVIENEKNPKLIIMEEIDNLLERLKQ